MDQVRIINPRQRRARLVQRRLAQRPAEPAAPDVPAEPVPSRPAGGPLAACIYLRDEGNRTELDRWQRVALDWCAANRYTVAHLIIDRDGSKWLGAMQTLAARTADVVVVGRPDHIPDTLPRIEVISEQRPRGQRSGSDPRQRRPRIIC